MGPTALGSGSVCAPPQQPSCLPAPTAARPSPILTASCFPIYSPNLYWAPLDTDAMPWGLRGEQEFPLAIQVSLVAP